MSRLLRVRGDVRDTFALSSDDLDEDDEIDGEGWGDDEDDEEDWDDDEWDEEEDEEEEEEADDEDDDLWMGDEDFEY